MVKELSFCGLRTIGFAYKRISEEEVSKYLVCPRDQYTMSMSALGLVAFDNKLKSDV
jgi:magnesium-transporting ATPase (P-type)